MQQEDIDAVVATVAVCCYRPDKYTPEETGRKEDRIPGHTGVNAILPHASADAYAHSPLDTIRSCS